MILFSLNMLHAKGDLGSCVCFLQKKKQKIFFLVGASVFTNLNGRKIICFNFFSINFFKNYKKLISGKHIQEPICIYQQFFFFFNCYLAAPWPTLGHYQGDSLTHLMLITAFYIFDPKVTGSLVARLGP